MNLIANTAGILAALSAGLIGGAVTDRVVDANVHIPLGVSVSVTMTFIGIAVVIARMVQKLQDSVDDLKVRDVHNNERVGRLEAMLEGLPCRRPEICQHKTEDHHAPKKRNEPEDDQP